MSTTDEAPHYADIFGLLFLPFRLKCSPRALFPNALILTVFSFIKYSLSASLIDASKEVGLEVNAEKTKQFYMSMSRHQNAGKNHNIKIVNRSFENVAKFRFLGTTGTNQNLAIEEIKSKLKSGNACYHSVQNLLSSRLLPENVKIKIY
jgi:hypothetical protein